MDDGHAFADSDEENAAIDAAAERSHVLDNVERSYDMMPVIVLEDVPNEVCSDFSSAVTRLIDLLADPVSFQAITRFLDANCKSLGHAFLWLTDTHENLPDYTDKLIWGQTEVDEDWRSPFVGKSLDDAAELVKSIDTAVKAVARNYFAVLLNSDHERGYGVLICKTPNEAVGRTEVQYTEYQVDKISGFFVSFDEDNWDVMMEEQGW